MARLLTNLATRIGPPFLKELPELTSAATRRKLLGFLEEKAKQATQSQLARKMRNVKGYYTLEMAPPSSNEMQKMQADFALLKEFIQSGCFKYLTIKQAWLLILVCTEVGLWFFMGETIGKMHLVGYKV